MSDLVECLVDGGTWIVGNFSMTRSEFEATPCNSDDGTFSIRLACRGYEYFYDGLVPEFDFKGGLENAKITFRLDKENIFAKRRIR